METVGLLLVAVLLPTAVGCGVVVSRRLYAAVCAARARPVAPPSIERVHADLRRLHDLLDDTENAPADFPAKHHRCQATRAAYLDVLAEACRQLQVDPPAGRRVTRSEIYRVEADLRRQGLDVRTT